MVWCVAYGCSNNTSKKDGPHKRFFTFPNKEKDSHRHSAWVKRVNRVDWRPSTSSRLCEDHFERESFLHPPHVFLAVHGRSGILRLKPDAVPTIFKKATPQPKKKERQSLASAKRRRIEYIGPSNSNKVKPLVQDVDVGLPTATTATATCTASVDVSAVCEDEVQHVGIQAQPHCMPRHTQTYWHPVSHGTQTTPSMAAEYMKKDAGVQTDQIVLHTQGTNTKNIGVRCQPSDDDDDEESEEDIAADDESDDPDWNHSDAESTDSDSDPSDSDYEDVRNSSQGDSSIYIVYDACLKVLLATCIICRAPCYISKRLFCGSMVIFEMLCEKGHQYRWESQPRNHKMPQGNLRLATGIFGSGSCATKVINSLRNVGVAMFSLRTYHNIQAHYIVPAVHTMWRSQQDNILNDLKTTQGIRMAGDARCCSPGHTAKYGSYSLMDLATNQVVDIQLIQANEVTSSQAMELEGLKRAFDFLKSKGISILDFVTDRHSAVKKYMKTMLPHVRHWFDVWHVAKGVYKKIESRAKSAKKSCGILGEWAKSIKNHIYWIARSSKGNQPMVKAKWSAMANHVINVHEGHHSLFPKCLHNDLEDREWITPGSKAHKELKIILENKLLVKDIGQLSHRDQTSRLESFHKVMIQFASKALHFHYPSMEARLLLAAIHYNTNSKRQQAETKGGEKQYRICYPKFKKGQAVVKPVKEEISYTYIEELVSEVEKLRKRYPSYEKAKELHSAVTQDNPPPISSSHPQVPKTDLITQHRSRFSTAR